MNQSEAKAILKQAFKALSPEHIENFRYHLKNETPVFCGHPSVIRSFTSAEGHG